MARFYSIKGWFECLDDEVFIVKHQIDEFWRLNYSNYAMDSERANLYQQGWIVQEQQINGIRFIFFGSMVNSIYVGFFEDLIKHILELGLN
ncbi:MULTISPECIES: hypothetical protein [unclassified Acinetobacter]|uniref:hypothetical protein n=1 Tax=unclassified Acinetobacter TaxID=196816 RepID=UPI0035B7C108